MISQNDKDKLCPNGISSILPINFFYHTIAHILFLFYETLSVFNLFAFKFRILQLINNVCMKNVKQYKLNTARHFWFV